MATQAINYEKAEAFLKSLTREQLEMAAEVEGVSLKHKKTTLVNAPRTKQQLVNALIAHEEAQISNTLSNWGKQSIQSKSLQELKVVAKYKGVSLTYKTYRDRVVPKTTDSLIEEILYYTNFASSF